jgi:hypothetical protein
LATGAVLIEDERRGPFGAFDIEAFIVPERAEQTSAE